MKENKMKLLIVVILTLSSFTAKSQSNFSTELNSGITIMTKEIETTFIGGEKYNETNNLANDKAYFYFQVLGNYNVNKYLSFGIGAGAIFLEDNTLIPLVVNSKIIYPTKSVFPFLNLDVGYAISTQKYSTGGLTYSFGAGLGIILNSFIDLTVKGNYQVINTETESNDYSTFSGFTSEYEFNFTNLSAGINFKF